MTICTCLISVLLVCFQVDEGDLLDGPSDSSTVEATLTTSAQNSSEPAKTTLISRAASPSATATWSTADVCMWLEGLGLSDDYTDTFAEEGIAGDVLLGLSKEDLVS